MKSTIASPAAAPPVRERGHARVRVCACARTRVCRSGEPGGQCAMKRGLRIRD